MTVFDKKDDIFKLMEAFEKSSIAELELEAGDGRRIKLSKVDMSRHNVVTEYKGNSPYAYPYIPEPQNYAAMQRVDAAAPEKTGGASGNAAVSADENVIKAPIIGTFYSASSPEAAPYVKTGDKVSKGAVICILEAMKVMNEIECEQDCEIVEILAHDGDVIQYGQPLFRIK